MRDSVLECVRCCAAFLVMSKRQLRPMENQTAAEY